MSRFSDIVVDLQKNILAAPDPRDAMPKIDPADYWYLAAAALLLVSFIIGYILNDLRLMMFTILGCLIIQGWRR